MQLHFFDKRSLRWKVLATNILLIALSLSALGGVQWLMRGLAATAGDSYGAMKAMRLSGQLMKSVSEMDGYLRLGSLAIKSKSAIPLDDIEITADEIKSGGLDLSGEMSQITELRDEAVQFESDLKVVRDAGEKFQSQAKSGKLSLENIDEYLATIQKLGKSIKSLASAMSAVSENSFASVVRAERLNFITLIASTCLMGLLLLLSIFSTNKIVSKFEQAIGNVKKGTLELQNQVTVLISQSNSLSSGASEGAAAVQETVSTLEEISAMVARSSDRIKQSSQASEKNFESAEQGRGTIQQATWAMDKMQSAIESFSSEVNQQNEKLNGVVKVIKEIANKTKVINDIVFQTKLLSFNASVEAARAGEQGRGFAVVAEEIGNLAKMSGSAAKEISSMVDNGVETVTDLIQSSRRKVEELSHDARSRSTETAKQLESSSKALEAIANGIGVVREFNQDILKASREQAEGVNNISTAMNQLDQTISLNASTARVTADTAQTFQELSIVFMQGVERIGKELFGESKDGLHLTSASSLSVTNTEGVESSKIPAHNPVQTKENVGAKVLSLSSIESYSKTSPVTAKKAAGESFTAPSADDERFKEV